MNYNDKRTVYAGRADNGGSPTGNDSPVCSGGRHRPAG